MNEYLQQIADQFKSISYTTQSSVVLYIDKTNDDTIVVRHNTRSNTYSALYRDVFGNLRSGRTCLATASEAIKALHTYMSRSVDFLCKKETITDFEQEDMELWSRAVRLLSKMMEVCHD